MPKALRDTLVWTLLSGLVLLLGMAVLEVLGPLLGAVWYAVPALSILFLFALLVGGPLAILLCGLARRHFGMVAGPLLLAAIAAAVFEGSDWVEMHRTAEAAAQLDMRTFIVSGGHDLIAMDLRNAECGNICKQILLQSEFRVAVKNDGGSWTIYRKIPESECRATWYTRHNFRFAGICGTKDAVDDVDSALMIATPESFFTSEAFPQSLWWAHGFRGSALALIDRRPGQKDVLLGRWVAGEVQIGRFRSQPFGRTFTRGEFYAAALGLKIVEFDRDP